MSSSRPNNVAVPKGLLILGFGGHARSVADVALSMGIRHLCFEDAHARSGENFLGHSVRGKWIEPLPDDWAVFPASGHSEEREAQCRRIRLHNWPLATLIAPSATLGAGCIIGCGTLVAHQAHIGPSVHIGEGCIINSGSVVDHESIIGDFSHVSVNATVAGRCRLGREVMLGAGATVIDKMVITDAVIVGAGGVVIDPVLVPGTYVGVPVRRLAPI